MILVSNLKSSEGSNLVKMHVIRHHGHGKAPCTYEVCVAHRIRPGQYVYEQGTYYGPTKREYERAVSEVTRLNR